MWLALLLSACEPAVKDTAAPADTGADTGADGDHTVVIATVAGDFSAGQLATVSADGTVTDAIFPTTTDPVVEVDGDRVILLDRSSENTVRVYDAADWSAPLVELSTGDGSNPQDAAFCGDVLVVSTYAGTSLGLYDGATGLSRGALDLSPYADADGVPEADAIVRGPDGHLYVSLNKLDTSALPWTSADGSGTIVRVDCETVTITEDWTVGPNPSISPHPADPNTILVRTGDYYNDDYSVKLDGALQTFDPVAGTVSEPLLTEAAFGYNLGSLAGNRGGHAMLVADDAYSWTVFCLDLTTFEATPTTAVDSFIGDAVTAPDGTAWIAYRQGYAGSGAPVIAGLVAWNPETCMSADPVSTLFPPYSLAIAP